MEGYGENIGVSPRAISELFRVIDSISEDWEYTVTFSTLEIYNETIRDLLDATADREKLDVRQTPNGNSVPGLTEVQVTSAAQVLNLMSQGQSNRAVGSHDMNEHSSRSHSILTLVCQGKCLRDGNSTYGKFYDKSVMN
jgi:kinesin family protein C2/C3